MKAGKETIGGAMFFRARMASINSGVRVTFNDAVKEARQ